MEQSTPVPTVSSELVAGQLPSNEGLRNIQQVITYICSEPTCTCTKLPTTS